MHSTIWIRCAVLSCIFAVTLSFIPVLASEKDSDIVTSLMRSTFKIEGGGVTATAFVMGQPSPYTSESFYFVLLTAAHVLDSIKTDNITVYFRILQEDVYHQFPCSYRIRDGKGTPLWVKHPDVDIAAMRISLPKGIDIQLIPTDLFATDSLLTEYGVCPGDRVFTFGFPLGLESNDAGFPILRTGYIASYPLTPMSKYKTFLIDSRVFEGNSGGPVLYESTHTLFERRVLSVTYRLVMGLVSQQCQATEKVKTLREEFVRRYEMSLAVIVQAQFLKDILSLLPPASEGERPSCTSP